VDPPNPPKSPAYRAPNSEVPQDQTETPNSRGVDPVRESATPLRLSPRESRYPREEALNIIEVQERGYMKATDGANGTIVMVPVDLARIPR